MEILLYNGKNARMRRITMKELTAMEEVHQFIQDTELGLIYVLHDS
ncbi:hypothetical protein V7200_20685 [Cytobacillus firmus]|uniref:Uncharacterized protein n=1 Tax=Cytobacillus firmus TaxID=1399 RepID=A0A800N9P5_CYTFI|nr:hypothetical protein [Cytobacillus firmus]KAF0822774.1 hypothetical protein KIS1582_3467 [Cytobacillus firmus]